MLTQLFFLVAMFLCASSSEAQPNVQCTSNLMSAFSSLINIGATIANATVVCSRNQNQICFKDITLITQELGRVTGFIKEAVLHCANLGSDCIDAVTETVALLVSSTDTVAKAAIDCKTSGPTSPQCQEDILTSR
jgi:hypothetical protein